MLRTQAAGQPLVPPGPCRAAVVAGQQTVPRQSETLVADVLYRGAHSEMSGGQDSPTVLHLPRVLAQHHCTDGNREGSELALFGELFFLLQNQITGGHSHMKQNVGYLL